MIDLLLKLLENLQKLAELRSARKRRAFKEMAEPLFDELLDVHKDYMLKFAEARSRVEKNRKNPKPAIKYLEKERRTFEPVRVKLAALAETLRQSNKPSVIDDFLFAVARYFPVGDVFAEQGTASTSLIAELKRRFLPEERSETIDLPSHIVIWGCQSPEEFEFAWQLALHAQARSTLSPPALIDVFISLQQQKWKTVCDTFAKVKAADLKA
jgi:hypothetical protein